VAQELGETSLMFPVHPTLSSQDMADMVAAIVSVVQSVQT
jgi:dTDP-4-amino-4,6-dideoxygalactose transaminase